ncbi:transcriptional regulator [Microbacterium sp. OR16]|uniref:transcriptional regulator n=1 Tax=Microbacterium sp. OR16 TaxID=3095345 RepID=UPI0039B684D4
MSTSTVTARSSSVSVCAGNRPAFNRAEHSWRAAHRCGRLSSFLPRLPPRSLGSILQVSDSALSKAISALETVRYVRVRRGRAGSRPRTWVAGTAEGRHAFQAHLDALRAIVEFGSAPAQSDQPGQHRDPVRPGQPREPDRPGQPGPAVAG